MESEIIAWATLIAALSALATAVISYLSMRSFTRNQQDARKSAKLNRIIQTVIHCNERYSEIDVARTMPFQISEETSTTQMQFFSRYWGLKSDQFDYWLAGFVDHDAFTTWMMSVAKHFSRSSDYFRGMDYLDGWVLYGRTNNFPINPMFVQLIDALEIKFRNAVNFEQQKQTVKDLLLDLEGTEAKPGTTQRFRREFQAAMDYHAYDQANTRFSTDPIFSSPGIVNREYRLATHAPTLRNGKTAPIIPSSRPARHSRRTAVGGSRPARP
ncbi:hypothetical protein [Glacieibacterium frigidum]|uniref:Uncharacterized protein n=1 Tax=Glacieibacterium frigidum TaxID=2593303 RepID=A0A552UHL9_9SPHN|nr:hypothetical protein [Glacieibacterium frigidum]TRW17719.1 hypothetical protein FMM06_06155 [Glacieibacterium frigidum]